MLTADELGQLRRIRVASEPEALRAAGCGHAVNDFGSFIFAQCALQHVARIVGATRGDEISGDGHVVALFEYEALGLFAELLELKDLESQGLDLTLLEVLEDFGRDLSSHSDEQRSRLLATLQVLES